MLGKWHPFVYVSIVVCLTGGGACPGPHPTAAAALHGRHHLCCWPPASRAIIGMGERDGAHTRSATFDISKNATP